MSDFRTTVLAFPLEQQETLFMEFYRAHWVNLTSGYKKKALNQLRVSAEVAEVGNFSLEKIFALQDKAVECYETERERLEKRQRRR